MKFTAKFFIDGQMFVVAIPKVMEKDIKAFVENLDTDYVQLTIAHPAQPRTVGRDSQSNCINGYIRQIAQQAGIDFEVCKMFLKVAASTNDTYPHKEIDLKSKYNQRHSVINPVSESALTKEQASDFIRFLEVFAMDWGYTLDRNT